MTAAQTVSFSVETYGRLLTDYPSVAHKLIRLLAGRLQSASLDLVALYLPGLDIVQHALFGTGEAVSPSALQARLEGLRHYYAYLDELLEKDLVQLQAERSGQRGRQAVA